MLRYTALGLMLVPFTAAVAAPAPTVADKDGYHFEYTTHAAPGGKVVIEGRMLSPTSAPFTYVVEASGKVHGMIDGSPVDFEISRPQYDGLMAETVQQNGVAVADASIGAQ